MLKQGALLLIFLTLCAPRARAEKILYQSNFEKAAAGPLPDEFLVLDGDFAIKENESRKYIELPGAPLDTFGVLFGPTVNAGVCVSARIYGTAKGRRYPSFGVGLNGPSGYKLKISPAKDALEIYQGDVSSASVPFRWKSGSWTDFKLAVQPDGPGWKIEGKAWPHSEPEPKDWTISVEATTAPHPGRASIWGSPYSGSPIRFDDLLLTAQ